MQRKIISFGEIVWDVFENGKTLGGAPLNFAYFCGKFGADARILSAVGGGELGARTLEIMRKNGIKTDFVETLEGAQTGRVLVKTENGIPSYEICSPAAWDAIKPSQNAFEFATKASAVYFGTLAQRGEVSRQSLFKTIRATPKKCLKIFDANLRQNYFSKDILLRSLEAANILKINDEELGAISKMFSVGGTEKERARAIFKMFNLSCLLLTRGERGHLVLAGEEEIESKTKAEKIADTVGAGDSFTARFACEILSGKSAAAAADLAAETAAQVCSRRGALEI
ncbi:MAG: hypothetical protein IKO42_05230 [Opitutales bacterium]|nr:hypothetical protein [Opitutales bacterium]